MSEVRLVVRQCMECGTTTTAPEKWAGTVFCKQACMDAYNQKKNFEKVSQEAERFMAANPEYYDSPYNNKLIGELLAVWKQEPSAANLEAAYLHLAAEKKILFKLTRKDIDAMDSPTYDAREKIDPQLGGALAEVEARGNAKFAAHTSYKMGGTGGWERMAAANLADRQRQADERAIANRKAPR